MNVINFKAAIRGAGSPENSQSWRQWLAVLLTALMVLVPMGQSVAYAQEPLPGVAPLEDQQAPPPTYDNDSDQPNGNYDQPPAQGQPAAQGQPLTAEQLNQLTAPIALYPDSLVAQVLAASTYPTQVVEANRWVKEQGNVSANELAERADQMNWDASVKALTAFPSVLERMDRNLQWTTDLGNAYYNQPQDVMASIQELRRQARESGNLRDTPQQQVRDYDNNVEIYPANPEVVYVPYYDPWAVWGYPLVPYPGFWYYPPPGIYFTGLFGWGFGINIGWWGGWGWGWNHWGCGWRSRSVFFNRTTFVTHSTTVFNRGFNRPGGPPRALAGRRGSFVNHGFTRTSSGGFTHSGAGFARGGTGNWTRGGGGNMSRGNTSGFTRGGNTSGFTRGGNTSGFTRGGNTSGFNGGGTGFNRGGASNPGSFNRGGQFNRGSFSGRPFMGSPSGGISGNMGRPSGAASRPSFGGGGSGGGRSSFGGGAPASRPSFSSGGSFGGGRPSGGGGFSGGARMGGGGGGFSGGHGGGGGFSGGGHGGGGGGGHAGGGGGHGGGRGR